MIIAATVVVLLVICAALQLNHPVGNSLTQTAAITKVKADREVAHYLKALPQGIVDVDHEENGIYFIHVYEVKDGHTATFNWYTVDKKTGSMKKEF